jgi:hypothetical protein
VVGCDRGRERDAGLGAAVHDHPIDVERRLAVLLPLPGRLDVRGRARRLRLQGLIKAPTIAVVTFDPAIVENEPDKQQLIDWDVRLAARLLMTASLEPPVGTYRWVPGFSEITHAIN